MAFPIVPDNEEIGILGRMPSPNNKQLHKEIVQRLCSAAFLFLPGDV